MKDYQFAKMLSNVSKSLLSPDLTELIIKASFWRSYDEMLTLPHYDPEGWPICKILSNASE